MLTRKAIGNNETKKKKNQEYRRVETKHDGKSHRSSKLVETSANSLFRIAIITSTNVDNARCLGQFNSNIKNNPFDDRWRSAGTEPAVTERLAPWPISILREIFDKNLFSLPTSRFGISLCSS